MKNQISLDNANSESCKINVNSNSQIELKLNVIDLKQSTSTNSGLHSIENSPSTNQVKICSLNLFNTLILLKTAKLINNA